MTGELVFRTARDLATALRTRELSAREVMQAHLDQIEAFNPAVNTIVSLDGDAAMDAADRADRRLAQRRWAACTACPWLTRTPT